MENERFITVQKICNHYNIEISFIKSLSEYGLIEITQLDEMECIDIDYLGEIERTIRLYYDLDINMAGIDAITHLLKRMHEIQNDLQILKNRLNAN